MGVLDFIAISKVLSYGYNMLNKKVLILEDDLRTIAILLDKLSDFLVIDKETNEMERIGFDVTVFADSQKAGAFLRDCKDQDFDLIILDRDCCSRGSFHSAGIDIFNPAKIIAISSVPEFNQELENKYGITRRVDKRLSSLESFATAVTQIAGEIFGA